MRVFKLKRLIACTYMQQAEQRSGSGRHRSLKVISDVRYDNYDHYVVPLQKQAEMCTRRLQIATLPSLS